MYILYFLAGSKLLSRNDLSTMMSFFVEQIWLWRNLYSMQHWCDKVTMMIVNNEHILLQIKYKKKARNNTMLQ